MRIRQVSPGDLDRCFQIESVSYAGDEAASRDKIKKRIEVYPQGFVGLEVDAMIAGFINAGATRAVDLADEAFKDFVGHDPDGEHAVILSLAVPPDFQGQGLAGKLIRHFIEHMRVLGKADIYLICQPGLVEFYAKYGFIDLGESGSTHGGLHWHGMTLSLVNG